MTPAILDLNPETYERHIIHTQERDWAETNCYVDVWIEQLHALGFEPIAAMPFTLGIDFEGDQWTFFKFQLSDLYQLYAIEVQELVVWKSLTQHIEEQIQLGRPVLVELDSMYLPDTQGTAYKIAHVKSTVSVNFIDIDNKKMGYFHAQGYYELEGDDFDMVFRLKGDYNDSHLEPYVEYAKLNRKPKLTLDETVQESIGLLKKQLLQMPNKNPFSLYKERLTKDLEWLKGEDIAMFHEYSFVTLRQLGACFELVSVYLNWLMDNGETDLIEAAQHYKAISEQAKVYQFQLARVVGRGRSIELTAIDEMADKWDSAKTILQKKYLG
jgi:hypothetical protein